MLATANPHHALQAPLAGRRYVRLTTRQVYRTLNPSRKQRANLCRDQKGKDRRRQGLPAVRETNSKRGRPDPGHSAQNPAAQADLSLEDIYTGGSAPDPADSAAGSLRRPGGTEYRRSEWFHWRFPVSQHRGQDEASRLRAKNRAALYELLANLKKKVMEEEGQGERGQSYTRQGRVIYHQYDYGTHQQSTFPTPPINFLVTRFTQRGGASRQHIEHNNTLDIICIHSPAGW